MRAEGITKFCRQPCQNHLRRHGKYVQQRPETCAKVYLVVCKPSEAAVRRYEKRTSGPTVVKKAGLGRIRPALLSRNSYRSRKYPRRKVIDLRASLAVGFALRETVALPSCLRLIVRVAPKNPACSAKANGPQFLLRISDFGYVMRVIARLCHRPVGVCFVK